MKSAIISLAGSFFMRVLIYLEEIKTYTMSKMFQYIKLHLVSCLSTKGVNNTRFLFLKNRRVLIGLCYSLICFGFLKGGMVQGYKQTHKGHLHFLSTKKSN